MLSFDLSLYLVTDRGLSLGRSIDWVVEKAVKGGVSMVQLREKEGTARAFYEQAIRLKKLLAPYRVPLIINDRLDIALACDADGVHIGQSDIPCPVVRKLLGRNKIIGLSVESIADAEEANLLEVDYIGISPVFSTLTKTDTAPELGLEGVRRITAISKHPSVGIGGINLRNADEIIKAGAEGIAVVSAIMSANDPEQAAQLLKNKISSK